jgi:hypothetical protein
MLMQNDSAAECPGADEMRPVQPRFGPQLVRKSPQKFETSRQFPATVNDRAERVSAGQEYFSVMTANNRNPPPDVRLRYQLPLTS